MTKEEILQLQPGVKLQVGSFRGTLDRVEHLIEAVMGDVWRVYFVNNDPVDSVDSCSFDIKLDE